MATMVRAEMLGTVGRDALTLNSRLSGRFDRLVNAESAITRINSQASSWKASQYACFNGMTLLDAQKLLGWAGIGSSAVLATRVSASFLDPIRRATSFDSRQKWPESASLIGGVRNQGDCGSCWAFGLSESLSNRFCVRGFERLVHRHPVAHVAGGLRHG
jgi:hypothetical protein